MKKHVFYYKTNKKLKNIISTASFALFGSSSRNLVKPIKNQYFWISQPMKPKKADFPRPPKSFKSIWKWIFLASKASLKLFGQTSRNHVQHYLSFPSSRNLAKSMKKLIFWNYLSSSNLGTEFIRKSLTNEKPLFL